MVKREISRSDLSNQERAKIKRSGTRSRDGGMGRMSAHTRRRVGWMWRVGFLVIKIRERLIEVSRKSSYFLLKKYDEINSVADLKRTPRRRLLGNEQIRFIDEAMEANPELTSRQLHGVVTEKFPDLRFPVSTVKRAQKALRWSAKRTHYYALISETNEEKRMTWCKPETLQHKAVGQYSNSSTTRSHATTPSRTYGMS